MKNLHATKYINLDCARGVASLLVLSGHLRAFVFIDYGELVSPGIAAKVFYFFTGLGHQSVMIFFVLSGFLISQSIYNSTSNSRWSWPIYATNRLSRLWTVLLPAILLTMFWDNMGKALSDSSYYNGELFSRYFSGPKVQSSATIYSFPTLLHNIFFLQTITAPTYGTNGPLWSLANEFWYYVLFPLGYLLLGGYTNWVNKILIALSIVILVAFLPYRLLLSGVVWLLGYGVFVLYQQEFIKRICGTHWYLGSSFLIFLATIVISRTLSTELSADYLVGVGFTLLMLGLLHYRIENPFYKRTSEFFSNISYTLYLTHFPFLSFIFGCGLKGQQFKFGVLGIALYVGVLIITILYGHILYCLFEKNTPKVRNFVLKSFQPKTVTLQS